ncbi:hypothetical protein SAMN04488136_10455 [Vibrio xiamenensis]|uniref:Uncharacterized protein n=1 Tax=Vibrio xiamenensis TaxID=861298 RepID=A0A1G7WY19_9VIBR|nr:hypothetical protein [Vibrio xiamenensis]SDG76823.1 hypothetical protein SAMN04488136_102251 [Vibrio xiamenensis]SDG88173.1 hypothetical protein SAMN04488136_10455 [Vibrio xiamenensis]
MTQILVGATNTSGKGSAADLTVDNGTQIILDQDSYYQAGYLAAYLDDGDLDIENLAGWGAADLKEISITDGDYSQLTITDFVDIAITDGDYESIIINQAKRATIDLSDSDQGVSVYLTPYSNNDHWSNLYQVTMGSGDDYVSFSMTASTNPNSTKWTEFDVDLGDGDDTFDYALKEAASDTQQRSVDGGDGFDSLLLSGDNSDIEFVNFEYVELEDGETLTLTEQDLINNSALEQGLIVNGKVALADDVSLLGMAINELSDEQLALLEENGYDSTDYVAVTLYTGDGDNAYLYDEEYTLIVKESDIDYSTFNYLHTSGSSGDTYWLSTSGLSYFNLWSSYQYESSQWLEVDATLDYGNSLVVYELASAANDGITRSIDGSGGVDTLLIYDDVNGLDFQNFEKIYNHSGDTLLLTQDLLDNNAAGSSLVVIGDFEVTENIDQMTVNLLSGTDSYYIESTEYTSGYSYDDYYVATLDVPVSLDLQIGDSTYSLVTELQYITYSADNIVYQLDASYDEDSAQYFSFEFGNTDDTIAYNVSFTTYYDYDDGPASDNYYFGIFSIDGGDGVDTIIFEQAPDALDFSNFEYVDVEFDGDLELDQTLLAENNSASEGLIVNSSVALVDDIQSIVVSALSDEQQALFDSVGVDSDEYSAVTVYYGEDSYTLLMDVDDLSYHLAA